jgi:hypothetical protein
MNPVMTRMEDGGLRVEFSVTDLQAAMRGITDASHLFRAVREEVAKVLVERVVKEHGERIIKEVGAMSGETLMTQAVIFGIKYLMENKR